jgi:hypothetical protein
VITTYCGNWTIDDIGKEEEILLSSLADGQDMRLRDTVGIYEREPQHWHVTFLLRQYRA